MIFEWLQRIGLEYAIEKFKLHGIDTAKKLQNIRVCEYDQLGVKDENDRKKLFALITKIRNVVETESNKKEDEKNRFQPSCQQASCQIFPETLLQQPLRTHLCLEDSKIANA